MKNIAAIALILAPAFWPGTVFSQMPADVFEQLPLSGTGSIQADPVEPVYDINKLNALEKATAAGDPDSTADLAAFWEQGYHKDGVQLGRAFDLYEKAAEKGHIYARQKICIAYLLGEGRTYSPAKAMPHCNALPDQDPAGLFSYGFAHEYGIGGPKDNKMALAFYLTAAKAGSGEAMDALGRKALEASADNAVVARDYFRKAIHYGSTQGLDHLAVMLESGQGGNVDKVHAQWLYVNAARRGNAHAKAWLASQETPPTPLYRVKKSGRDFLSEVVMSSTGEKTKTWRVPLDIFPSGAYKNHKEGKASLHCYINASHILETCIVQREFPVGYHFGAMLQAVYNKKLKAQPVDELDRKTANSIYEMTISWQLE